MAPANDQPLKVHVADDGIATLTLNRPAKRNALSIALRDMLVQTLHQWQDDESVRVVVLTGAPPAFFGFEDSFRIEHDDVFDNFLPSAMEGTS